MLRRFPAPTGRPDAHRRDAPGLLAAVGHTPLVTLPRLSERLDLEVFAKLEMLNPAGSAKDRPALRILLDALDEGRVAPGDTVIESSSGNMGVALAQCCRVLGLRFICVVDPRTSALNLKLLRVYGAEVDLVERPHPETGAWLDARIERVQARLAADSSAWWPNQYENPSNRRAHAEGTAQEILDALGSAVDVAICATSTCGTLAGLVTRLRPFGTQVFGVDAVGSKLFGGPPGARHLPGMGSSRQQVQLDEAPDRVVHVTDLDCVAGCLLLLDQEAVLAGATAGGVVTALHRVAPDLRRGARVVLVLVDRGERYLDTVYDPRWVRDTLGADAPMQEVFACPSC